MKNKAVLLAHLDEVIAAKQLQKSISYYQATEYETAYEEF